ncbi:MAG: glycosyltransferase family 4 protein [Candidatus Omnitrophota bacterium]
MDKKKITIINHEFPPVGGGASMATKNFAEALSSEGYNVEVVTSRSKDMKSEENLDGYKVKRAIGTRKYLYAGRLLEVAIFMLHGMWYFLRSLGEKHERPDLVLAFFTLPAGFLALFVKKLYKIPYYVFLRGIDVPGFYGGRFSFLNKLLSPLIRYVWANADKVVANSQSFKDLALKTYDKKEIHVIPNVIDLESFSPAVAGTDDHEPKLVFIGRLNKQKGLTFLLEALSLLNKWSIGLHFSLKLIGDGPERWSLAQQAKDLDIKRKVSFLGWMDRKSLPLYYKEADIFITPSLDESFNITILEAMACGLPIIATDLPAHRELIKNDVNGILVPPGDAASLAKAIRLLVDHADLRHKFGANNRQKAGDYDSKKLHEYLQDLMTK